jgi:hypothetical protein
MKRPNESKRSTVRKLKTKRTARQALDAEREPNSNLGIEMALVMLKGCGLSSRSTRNKIGEAYDGETPPKKGRKWKAKFDGPLMRVDSTSF